MNKFTEMCAINVNDIVEKKGKFDYLSWAHAWKIFKEAHPLATYEVLKTDAGMPYFIDDCGAFCFTRVTVDELTHEMWLPVMDMQNKAVKAPDAMQVNKAIMRCLVKNLAMFGLGLYSYAGEDLPDEPPAPPPAPLKPVPVIQADIDAFAQTDFDTLDALKDVYAKLYKRAKDNNQNEFLTQIINTYSIFKQTLEQTA